MLTRPQLDKYADVLVWGLFTSRTEPYKPGDVVLLSPATASFDLYDGYKARGRDFQRIFAALPMNRDAGERT